jgi:hypothetical protein
MKNVAPILAGLIVALAGVAIWSLPAVSQMDMLYVPTDSYPELTRPAVPFEHEKHNEMAGLDSNCVACHHYYEDGKLVKGMDSVGMACVECHSLDGEGKYGQPSLTDAYHLQCMGCHDQKDAGPITCGDCHKG